MTGPSMLGAVLRPFRRAGFTRADDTAGGVQVWDAPRQRGRWGRVPVQLRADYERGAVVFLGFDSHGDLSARHAFDPVSLETYQAVRRFLIDQAALYGLDVSEGDPDD